MLRASEITARKFQAHKKRGVVKWSVPVTRATKGSSRIGYIQGFFLSQVKSARTLS